MQLCTLQSIKTGRCPEDCKYCPQSAHYDTGLEARTACSTPSSIAAAAGREALRGGASRFCMGAAWREVRDGPQFDSVLTAVREVSGLGLEVCCTLGMVTAPQAARLKEAGCTVYNHNLDTSREYYPEIITTRTYDERLATLAAVRSAGLQVCSGGILGMGEAVDDRLKLLVELASARSPAGIGAGQRSRRRSRGLRWRTGRRSRCLNSCASSPWRACPASRTMVRLSAGRTAMSDETQALCFLAGANSIFLGDKLLTTPNPERSRDMDLFERLGLHPLQPAIA